MPRTFTGMPKVAYNDAEGGQRLAMALAILHRRPTEPHDQNEQRRPAEKLRQTLADGFLLVYRHGAIVGDGQPSAKVGTIGKIGPAPKLERRQCPFSGPPATGATVGVSTASGVTAGSASGSLSGKGAA